MTATTYTTTFGTEYIVEAGEHGPVAYPAEHPSPPRKSAFYDPKTMWDSSIARSLGLFVDSSLDQGQHAVKNAGREWLEVYWHLKGLPS